MGVRKRGVGSASEQDLRYSTVYACSLIVFRSEQDKRYNTVHACSLIVFRSEQDKRYNTVHACLIKCSDLNKTRGIVLSMHVQLCVQI